MKQYYVRDVQARVLHRSFLSSIQFKGLKDIEILFRVNICQRDSSFWPRIVVGRRLSMIK